MKGENFENLHGGERVPPTKTRIQENIDGIKAALSMLLPGSYFLDQTIANFRGTIKPIDILHHGVDVKTVILIPGFLCNQGVMGQLGDRLSQSMNVIYPDIGAGEQIYKSLPNLADSIVEYILKLEKSGKLKPNGEYILVGHSLGGSLAVLVSSKLRAKHIIQVSAPNDAPDVAKIAGLGFIPALADLRDIRTLYSKVKMNPESPIGRLTTVTGVNDRFIGTNTQSIALIPPNITINRVDGIVMKGGHIDPIMTPSGIETIARLAEENK